MVNVWSQFIINQSTNKIVIKYLLGSDLSNLDSLYYKVHLPYAQCSIMALIIWAHTAIHIL